MSQIRSLELWDRSPQGRGKVLLSYTARLVPWLALYGFNVCPKVPLPSDLGSFAPFGLWFKSARILLPLAADLRCEIRREISTKLDAKVRLLYLIRNTLLRSLTPKLRRKDTHKLTSTRVLIDLIRRATHNGRTLHVSLQCSDVDGDGGIHALSECHAFLPEQRCSAVAGQAATGWFIMAPLY
jgi:hypothetical protein